MQSHLTKLIRRVREVPAKLKTNPIFIAKIINLIEYLRYKDDYTEFEKRKALALIKAHDLNHLVFLSEERFNQELKKFEKHTCMICSRSLSYGDKRRGMCKGCRSKEEIKHTADLRKWRN